MPRYRGDRGRAKFDKIFTPSGSSYQEKPQQSYGYDDGIDDGQHGFSPEARGFVPRSKSQDKTAQAKPETERIRK